MARLTEIGKQLVLLTLTLALVTLVAASSWGHMPPKDAIQQFKNEGVWEKKLTQLREFDARNRTMLAERDSIVLKEFGERMASMADGEVDTFKVIVILVEFPDFKHDDLYYNKPGGGTQSSPYVGDTEDFDSLLFTRQGIDPIHNPIGSMTEFYLENSYGKHLILGDVVGWVTAPNNYYHYVGDNDGMGGGGNELARDAVIEANDLVDFRNYTQIGGDVPVMIVHAGPGAEQGGVIPTYGIWSHRSSFPSVNVDGVLVSNYAMDPEEYIGGISGVGVFCHEWGHVLGLPDLYDIDYSPAGSEGIGDFSIMAGGSWNENGRRPAQFDAYSKVKLNFVRPVRLTQNLANAQIPQVETEPIVYMLRNHPDSLAPNPEFWLVENRQKVGFDASIPAAGLCIYHVDLAAGVQTNPDRYLVCMEQADGRFQMNYNGSQGDAGDPYPGTSNNRSFHDYSTPNSRTNVGDSLTQVGVWDISDSDSLMTADLDVFYSRPWPLLAGDSIMLSDPAPGGNGNGIPEPGEVIELDVEVHNIMKQTFTPTASLSVNKPGIEILQNNVYMGVSLNPATNQSTANYSPIKFRVSEDFLSSEVTLTITVKSYENFPNGGKVFNNTFTKKVAIGEPMVLLVDDDGGNAYQTSYTAAFNHIGFMYDTWNKGQSGSPSAADLQKYAIVFWMTGSPFTGGQLNASDVTALKAFLDGGGALAMTSNKAVDQLATLDSAFLADYLHIHKTGTTTNRSFRGVTGNSVGNNLKYYSSQGSFTRAVMEPANGGQNAFVFADVNGDGDYGIAGVTYDGSYKTVVVSFGAEFLNNNSMQFGFMPTDTLMTHIFDFLIRGNTTDVDDDTPANILPGTFSLAQNYPNPFNPSTVIEYSIPSGKFERVELAVFNVLGQRVTTLVNTEQGPGSYEVTWEGEDAAGHKVASGVYFYRLSHGGESATKKMMLLK